MGARYKLLESEARLAEYHRLLKATPEPLRSDYATSEAWLRACAHRESVLQEYSQKYTEAARAVKPTVLVVLEGGLVRDIFCTHPLEVQTDVFDFDEMQNGGACLDAEEYQAAHFQSGNIEYIQPLDGTKRLIEINTDKYPYVLTAEGPKPAKEQRRMIIVIPEHDDADDPYPGGIQPGRHDLATLLRIYAGNPEAVRFIADMIEI